MMTFYTASLWLLALFILPVFSPWLLIAVGVVGLPAIAAAIAEDDRPYSDTGGYDGMS